MISTQEAIDLINLNTNVQSKTVTTLLDALNCVLFDDIQAPIDLPSFNQSAMDGYAVKMNNDNNLFKIIGEIKAGDDASDIHIEPGEAIKIFTGAMCPISADLVCRIEDITEDLVNQKITINAFPKLGANIRLKGEQIKSDKMALKSGHIISSATVGFLASLGIIEVSVFKNPQISILSTGNELTEPGATLEPGKIFESNSLMLQTALQSLHIKPNNLEKLKDNLSDTANSIRRLLEVNDILIISGGISVGDYDFVEEALKLNGVKSIFYKVNQKPGKPLYFGTKGNKLIFALPGNPAAALTCFYIYIYPAIQKMIGKGFTPLSRVEKQLVNNWPKPLSREQFLKAKSFGDRVEILEGQSSAMLHTFAEANALVYIPVGKTYSAGDFVKTFILP